MANARKALLVKEKEFIRFKDELTKERQDLPWVKIEKDYQFDEHAIDRYRSIYFLDIRKALESKSNSSEGIFLYYNAKCIVLIYQMPV
jgi:hypothetical protein